jgi:predicted 3-demethylubiquinone-9 3-methyltransferase (glyoxalase superfamily)
MQIKQRIAPCLWFDQPAEEAAQFYVSVFKNSKIVSVARYPQAGQETHKKPAGSVMTVAFELDGQPFTALNGGPNFKFNEALSLQINCENQAELDYYWEKLSKGGDPKAQQCGWLKDKYGLSWQVVPTVLLEMFKNHESQTALRAMEAMLGMKKITATPPRAMGSKWPSLRRSSISGSCGPSGQPYCPRLTPSRTACARHSMLSTQRFEESTKRRRLLRPEKLASILNVESIEDA